MSKAARIKEPTQTSLDDVPELGVKKARILGRGRRKDRQLRALREASDKTQEEIAKAAGMDQSEISSNSATTFGCRRCGATPRRSTPSSRSSRIMLDL